MSHTPGPWEWVKPKNSDGWDNNGPDLRSVELGKTHDAYWGPDGMGKGKWPHEPPPPIPTILTAWGHDAWGIDVSEDDARLIAAAPDMLDALKAAIADLQYFSEKEGGQDRFASFHKARAVIAKATGESQCPPTSSSG